MIRYRWMYLLAVPGLLYFLIFQYAPMWGILLAFQDYNPYRGFWGSEWVGFENFRTFFSYGDFWPLLRNTLTISVLNLLLSFPAPIILALMINEVRTEAFKRITQTVVYLPHFLSWVIVVSFTFLFFSLDIGFVNKALASVGLEKIPFLSDTLYFYGLLVGQTIWKEVGWGTIIFLAAIAGVDPQLYEAATVDGAGRLRKIWHVTLPAIRSTIVILLILRTGDILNVGFEQILLMLNPMVQSIGDVFDTYVYRQGILSGNFSYSIAVGLFKSVAGLILVAGANFLSKKFGEEGLY
ncbi:sugar ABC transporter permease [Paenibacillus antri]|uniref:Sugar ABC transporter permease n=1 Tax=Paenibacillus antri TaxID=2582848 RepID=A0A5R9G6D3_9BACL|nr:sugar ABC transporter permease [Paenibacillus antri]